MRDECPVRLQNFLDLKLKFWFENGCIPLTQEKSHKRIKKIERKLATKIFFLLFESVCLSHASIFLYSWPYRRRGIVKK